MNPRIIKEIRPLLPAFALALGGLVIGLILSQSGAYWGLMISAFGCILMGITTFGDEISNRTMPLLLSQPLSRRTIWREKMTALALAIGALVAVAVAILICICLVAHKFFEPDVAAAISIPWVFGLGVFCTAPFATLALKNIPAAVAGVIAMPFGLVVIASVIFVHLPAFKAQHDNEIVQAAFLLPVLVVYFSACYLAGRHLFLKMEALDAQAEDIVLPAGLERSLARPFKAMIPQFTGPWSSLINKELHLQRLNFIMAAMFCILAPLAYLAWKLSTRFSTSEMGNEIALSLVVTTFVIYVTLIPLISGAGCIAEEKNWKIHEWHLTLPPSKLKQWFIKVLVTLTITAALGILLPCIFLVIGNLWKPEFIFAALLPLPALCLGIFASSISTNSMRAIILTLVLLGLGIAAAISGNAAASPVAQQYFADYTDFMTKEELGHYLRQFVINCVLLSFVAMTLILFLSYINYRTGATSTRRAWIHSALILATIWVAAFIFNILAGFLSEATDGFHLS